MIPTAYVRIEKVKTEGFEINSGVKHGDALSAALFNIALEKTLNALNVNDLLSTKRADNRIC